MCVFIEYLPLTSASSTKLSMLTLSDTFTTTKPVSQFATSELNSPVTALQKQLHICTRLRMLLPLAHL